MSTRQKTLTVVIIRIVASLGILCGILFVVTTGLCGWLFGYIFGFQVREPVVLELITFLIIGFSLIVCGIYIFRKANWARIGFIITLFIMLISDALSLFIYREDPDMISTMYIDLYISIAVFVFVLLFFTSRSVREYFLEKFQNSGKIKLHFIIL